MIDAISTDNHAACTCAKDAAFTVVVNTTFSDVQIVSTGAESAASFVVFDAATDVHGFLMGVLNTILTGVGDAILMGVGNAICADAVS